MLYIVKVYRNERPRKKVRIKKVLKGKRQERTIKVVTKRKQEAERTKDHRIVPLAAAIGFVNGDAFTAAEKEDLKALYEIGGLCYYGDKAQ